MKHSVFAVVAGVLANLMLVLGGVWYVRYLDPDLALHAAPAGVAEDRGRWLAEGRIPGAGTQFEAFGRKALLDLLDATEDNGAVLAGWVPPWRYVWPRDASYAAVALGRSGHPADADRVLGYLDRITAAGQPYAARYHPDGRPLLDGRPAQSDGTGWVAWALTEVAMAGPEPEARVYVRYADMLSKLGDTLLGQTAGAGALPAPSPDYWELPERRLTLGTAAPLLLGLRRTAQAEAVLGDQHRAGVLSARADVLAASIERMFGPVYARYPGADPGERDAAVAFLLPPFTSTIDPAVRAAWQGAAACMSRPAGGLAPGCDWKPDGTSWTPETALFAFVAAKMGDQQTATRWIDFLSDHVTADGSIPEKVRRNGQPAAVAPLAWSDACAVLALLALDSQR